MLSKKYIFILAVASLVFSCQKENIKPNSQSTNMIDENGNAPAWRSSNGDDLGGNSGTTSLTSIKITNDKTVNGAKRDNDDDITDPNNDDDRNKKKKN